MTPHANRGSHCDQAFVLRHDAVAAQMYLGTQTYQVVQDDQYIGLRRASEQLLVLWPGFRTLYSVEYAAYWVPGGSASSRLSDGWMQRFSRLRWDYQGRGRSVW